MMEMTREEAEEILYPNMKQLTFDEGFKIYKKFFGQPKECGTTLYVEGYDPMALNGFTIWATDANDIPIEVTEEMLLSQYEKFLNKVERVYP
ncbi:MAG: hypothetical protein AB7D96_02210 [Arcobacteraceae bacterium]